jgi:hypothetical protein
MCVCLSPERVFWPYLTFADKQEREGDQSERGREMRETREMSREREKKML